MPGLLNTVRRPLIAGGLAALLVLIVTSTAFALAALRVDGRFKPGGKAKITAVGFKRGVYGAYLVTLPSVGATCSGIISLPRRFTGTAIMRGTFPKRQRCYFAGRPVGTKRTRPGGYIVTVCQGGRTGSCNPARDIVSTPVNLK